MPIEYFHASKYGNGAKVAEEFRALMAAKGVTVNVHHVRDAEPDGAAAGRPLSSSVRPAGSASPSGGPAGS
ncbi:MAG: hypothetical protein MZV64_14400 [Ignavibacteriales bacterium]|nr:hypothetical protein [Ignavibacteriales bacterium]